MDASAILEISNLAVQATKSNRLDTFTPAFIHEGDAKSLEAFQAGRSRFRGTFSTTMQGEFVSYVKKQHIDGIGAGDAKAQGFIDPKKCSAKVFFNLGDTEKPGHADWTASLALEPTAAYAALRKIEGVPLTQKALVEWIEDWSANLGTDDGLAKSLAAIRSLTISQKKDVTHTDKDFGASRSALEDIEAKSEAGLPSHLIFTTEPYPGFQSRDFKLRLSVITGEKPALVLRTVSRELVEEDIAREFKASLIEDISYAANLTIGSFTP